MSLEGWIAAADKALSLATAEVRLIRAVTPCNAEVELARLERDFGRGERRLPEWQYAAPELRADLPGALERLGDHLASIETPLAQVYAERARELAIEASIVRAVGSIHISVPAGRRFFGSSADERALGREAHDLAIAWAGDAEGHRDPPGDDRVSAPARGGALSRTCDADDPASLVSTMSREAGSAHLPMRVIVEPGLASLAATGDGFILIAKGRWITARATARTVLHEIAGHALPRAQAAHQPLRIHVLGTARGVDDQEGRALLIERDAGFLDSDRRRELAFRHLAAELALSEATFVDSVDLLTAKGAPLAQALRIAARVHRGSAGVGGLGREVVYLTALLRVEKALSADDSGVVARVMSCGRIAAAVAPLVAEVTQHQATIERDASRLGHVEAI